ncbi:hypothetical protein KC717_01670 [Candidatus Dojkabacteria bacterium]|uniref:Uncharacterized protein n=1 Tax=Candidatus Dojkabacteria bacterium TaxID=2099670 RepID=A0A955L839_9BACT|nr:hypothetical protein [Candidatus Dojkabacteria bacterium]
MGIYILNSSSYNSSEETLPESIDTAINSLECDNSNSDYFSFHGVEEVIISENPCEVIWLLAMSEEEYTLETTQGKTIYVTVWRDYVNNIEPGNTFTIRGLDVIDTNETRESATISITRWVNSAADLEQAKQEVADAVKNL